MTAHETALAILAAPTTTGARILGDFVFLTFRIHFWLLSSEHFPRPLSCAVLRGVKRAKRRRTRSPQEQSIGSVRSNSCFCSSRYRFPLSSLSIAAKNAG